MCYSLAQLLAYRDSAVPPSNPIQSTTEPLLPNDECASNPTLALLPRAWDELATWAEENHILGSLILIVDATMALERPGAIGTVLHYLVRPDVLDILSLWSAENSTAMQLYC